MRVNGWVQTVLPLAAIPLLLLAATPAHAAGESKRVTVSGRVNERGYGVSGTFTTSLDGSLNDSGPLLRFDLAYGESESTNGADNSRFRGGLLVGYQLGDKDWKARFYTGIVYDARDSSTAGKRDGAGAMVKVEAMTSRRGPVYATVAADFITRDTAYRVSARAAVNAGPFFIGPEVAASGSDYYESQQVGLVLDDIDLGGVRLSLRGGYSFGSDEGADRDSAYGGLGLTTTF